FRAAPRVHSLVTRENLHHNKGGRGEEDSQEHNDLDPYSLTLVFPQVRPEIEDRDANTVEGVEQHAEEEENVEHPSPRLVIDEQERVEQAVRTKRDEEDIEDMKCEEKEDSQAGHSV